MRKTEKSRGTVLFIALIAVISTVLLIAAVHMLSSYSDDMATGAENKAAGQSLQVKASLYDCLSEYTAKATGLSILAEDCKDYASYYELIAGVKRKADYSQVREVLYFSDGGLYDENGDTVTHAAPVTAHWAQMPDVAGYTGVFTDVDSTGANMETVGFYAPVRGSDSFADAIVLLFPKSILSGIFPRDEVNENAVFSVLAVDNSATEILDGKGDYSASNVADSLRTLIGEQEPVTRVVDLIRRGESGVVRANIRARHHVISVCADHDKLKDLAVVELYDEETLVAESMNFVDAIIMIIALFAVVDVAIVVYLFVRNMSWRRAYYKMETSDAELQCPNRSGFGKIAENVLSRHVVGASKFYVISMQLRHYKHIKDSYGESETRHLLLHCKAACSKIMGIDEAFGHCGEGRFFLLLHARSNDDLVLRLKTLSYLASKYRTSHRFDIFFRYGIYAVNAGENFTAAQMMEFAEEANKIAAHSMSQGANLQYNYYSDELRKIQLMNEDMELRMDGALKDGEFQVFYQPKYSIKHGKQDGAEALVRWYDPKTKKFNPPALFLNLFETNGFIVKLDKYVYTKVCEYLSYSIAHGRRVYPVSVNVSRLTAIQPDFVEYYHNTKVKYGISDGLIMVEFTESFAYEDYTTLLTIVEALHAKGFRCSIDDFGSGYSSYRILKSLPVDEVKLDKFFLEKSASEQRDDIICTSIIRLAKDLGMKVTQEGIETEAELKRLISFGCDTIQGYYYSHPLPLSDYIMFTASSSEHNIT